jgi:hypothetical protein
VTIPKLPPPRAILMTGPMLMSRIPRRCRCWRAARPAGRPARVVSRLPRYESSVRGRWDVFERDPTEVEQYVN